MPLVGYIRVSTDYQAESKHGLDAQKNAIQKYSSQSCIEIKEIFSDEGLSGSLSLEKRPGILNAINSLSKGDLLIVAKRDRLGRDALVMAMIESAVKRKGARIISAAGEGTESDDPTGMLMRRMIDAFAEYERLIIGLRVSAALQAKKKKNERVGYIPYGYKLSENGVHLIEDSQEQKVLDVMFDFRTSGYSIRKIAQHLNEREILNRGGNKWNHSSILRVCINRMR